MKTLCVTLVTLVSLALNVSALSFQGTFIGTVTFISGAGGFGLDSVGDTFNGSYSYESAGVNGLFQPNSGNLKVTFNMPNGTTLTEANDESFPVLPLFAVSGGAVTGFDYFFNPAGQQRDLYADATSWESRNPTTLDMSGTMSFSRPVQASVPDAGSSALLLGLACLGLLSVRRWLATA